MKRNFDSVKRLVIKIGTSSLVLPSGKINLEKIDQLAFVISSLHNKGIEVVLVSSGAMGFGLNVLDLEKRPAEVGKQQAVSSRAGGYDEPLFAGLFTLPDQDISVAFDA